MDGQKRKPQMFVVFKKLILLTKKKRVGTERIDNIPNKWDSGPNKEVIVIAEQAESKPRVIKGIKIITYEYGRSKCRYIIYNILYKEDLNVYILYLCVCIYTFVYMHMEDLNTSNVEQDMVAHTFSLCKRHRKSGL